MQHRAVALAASMTLLASGCGLLGSASTTPRAQASLTVNNLSDMPICDVHLAPSRDGLAETDDALLWFERIEPGSSQTFGLDAGRYAMRLCDCDGIVLYGRRRMEVTGSRRLDFRALEVMRRSRSRTRGVASAPIWGPARTF